MEPITFQDFERLPPGLLEKALLALPYNRIEELSQGSEEHGQGKITAITARDNFWRQKVEHDFTLPPRFEEWVSEWRKPNQPFFFAHFFIKGGSISPAYRRIDDLHQELEAINTIKSGLLLDQRDKPSAKVINLARERYEHWVELDRIRDRLYLQGLIRERRELAQQDSNNDRLVIRTLFLFDKPDNLAYQEALTDNLEIGDLSGEELGSMVPGRDEYLFEQSQYESAEDFSERMSYWAKLLTERLKQLSGLLKEGDIVVAQNNHGKDIYFYVTLVEGQPQLWAFYQNENGSYLPPIAADQILTAKPRLREQLRLLLSTELDTDQYRHIMGFVLPNEKGQLIGYDLPIFPQIEPSQSWSEFLGSLSQYTYKPIPIEPEEQEDRRHYQEQYDDSDDDQ